MTYLSDPGPALPRGNRGMASVPGKGGSPPMTCVSPRSAGTAKAFLRPRVRHWRTGRYGMRVIGRLWRPLNMGTAHAFFALEPRLVPRIPHAGTADCSYDVRVMRPPLAALRYDIHVIYPSFQGIEFLFGWHRRHGTMGLMPCCYCVLALMIWHCLKIFSFSCRACLEPANGGLEPRICPFRESAEAGPELMNGGRASKIRAKISASKFEFNPLKLQWKITVLKRGEPERPRRTLMSFPTSGKRHAPSGARRA